MRATPIARIIGVEAVDDEGKAAFLRELREFVVEFVFAVVTPICRVCSVRGIGEFVCHDEFVTDFERAGKVDHAVEFARRKTLGFRRDAECAFAEFLRSDA